MFKICKLCLSCAPFPVTLRLGEILILIRTAQRSTRCAGLIFRSEGRAAAEMGVLELRWWSIKSDIVLNHDGFADEVHFLGE